MESEEKYRTLIQNLNIGVYRISGGDKSDFIQINSAMTRIFGYDSVDALMGVPVTVLYQDPSDRLDFLREISLKGFVKGHELRLKKRDGTSIIVACSAQAEYDEEGRIKWIDGFLEDVTRKKLAEQKLTEQREELDKINTDLKWKVEQLEAAFNHIKRLEGLMPICASCKKMLVEGGDPKDERSWVPFERFISERTDASFTHGLCPECVKKMYGKVQEKE
jgi:PAS domain S-box-containing protein